MRNYQWHITYLRCADIHVKKKTEPHQHWDTPVIPRTERPTLWNIVSPMIAYLSSLRNSKQKMKCNRLLEDQPKNENPPTLKIKKVAKRHLEETLRNVPTEDIIIGMELAHNKLNKIMAREIR